ncbi:MAG: AAA family ATPase [Flavobacteriaceae bacterium]|nr:MAG: AAA family ATPase [Flavobacteriaceae bacterium]
MQQKIVLIGGPGTGKTSVVNQLVKQGYYCMPEISREITLNAQKEGIDQLFLTDPLLFSKLLLEGREKQFLNAAEVTDEWVFFDRGLPDIYAYLEFSNTKYPPYFKEKCTFHKYDKVYLFLPWKEIYHNDNERYEAFEGAKKINSFIEKAYRELGYTLINVPFGSLKERTDFIINSLKSDI